MDEEKKLLQKALDADKATRGNPPAPADQIHVRDAAGQFTPRTQQPPAPEKKLCTLCGTPLAQDSNCPNGCVL